MKKIGLILIFVFVSLITVAQTNQVRFSGYSIGYAKDSTIKFTEPNQQEGIIMLDIKEKIIYIGIGNKITSYKILLHGRINNCYESYTIEDETNKNFVIMECLELPYIFVIGPDEVYRFHVESSKEENNNSVSLL